MTRGEASRVVAAAFTDEAVVASLGHPAYDLFAAGDRPLNFYTWGSMGLACSIGLGLAMAQPSRRVVVLDGDGSLLMNLGALATIGMVGPRNLTIVIWDNGSYGTTGAQASATSHGADLAAIARGAGIRGSAEVRTPGELTGAIVAARASEGPCVIVAKVRESAPVSKPPFDCVYLKHRFVDALGAPEPGTRGTRA